jgi:hypothetical protein
MSDGYQHTISGLLKERGEMLTNMADLSSGRRLGSWVGVGAGQAEV